MKAHFEMQLFAIDMESASRELVDDSDKMISRPEKHALDIINAAHIKSIEGTLSEMLVHIEGEDVALTMTAIQRIAAALEKIAGMNNE